MIKFETLNELTLKVTFDMPGEFIHTKVGAMIGMQGQNTTKPIEFAKELIGPSSNGNLASGLFQQALRRVTGENMPLMKATSTGQSIGYFANQGDHIIVLNLSNGQKISVESENLLAFTNDCKYGVAFVGMGVVSQGGLCKSTLTGVGPNAQAAIICQGNPIIMQGQCVCDPDAYIAHMGSDPSFGIDINIRNLIGQASGESYNMQFKDPNNIVIIQPFERQSGVNIGMDGGDNGRRASTQNNQSLQDAGHSIQGTFGQIGNQLGGEGGLGGIIGNFLR